MAVIVRLSATFAFGVVVAAASDRLDAEPTLTVTDRPDPLEIEPSVTVMLAVSAFFSRITPLLAPDTVATPLVNVIAVAVPKSVAVPTSLETVGWKVPLLLAPPKVRVLLPVYEVAVLPNESR